MSDATAVVDRTYMPSISSRLLPHNMVVESGRDESHMRLVVTERMADFRMTIHVPWREVRSALEESPGHVDAIETLEGELELMEETIAELEDELRRLKTRLTFAVEGI